MVKSTITLTRKKVIDACMNEKMHHECGFVYPASL